MASAGFSRAVGKREEEQVNIGVTVGLGARAERTLDGLIARGRQIEQQGFHSVWMPHAFGFDAMTALTLVGRETARIEIGTAVVPTFPRHPAMMAQQALTAQAALGGRFTLGVGLSHKVMMEDALGLSYAQPARHMREYLAVLAPLLAGEGVTFSGETYRVTTSLTVGGATPVPLIIAAMGPAMLRLAGTVADGTITSWVGPRTLGQHIVPGIAAAAQAAGRPPPRIVAGLPILLTNDADAARAQLAQQAAWYNTLPSYRAMLDREGASGPADVALIGDERILDAGLQRLAEAGVTDFSAHFVTADAGLAAQTFDYLASRL